VVPKAVGLTSSEIVGYPGRLRHAFGCVSSGCCCGCACVTRAPSWPSAARDVVAEKRNARGVASVARRQSATGVGGVLRASKHCPCAQGDVRQADAVFLKCVDWSGLDVAAVHDGQIGDRDIAEQAGGEMEVTRRIAPNRLDGSDQHAAAGHEQRSAGVASIGLAGTR
jgi:hypothetical protein